MPSHLPPPSSPVGQITGSGVLAEILAELIGKTGVDVREHRAQTIQRRVLSRMSTVGLTSLHDYLDFLRHSHNEAASLLERVSIKVSQFYRNPEAFDFLSSEAIPRLRSVCAGRSIRVWCAGCGRGEEAWTLAMLLRDVTERFSVLATDIDENALSHGRVGEYSASALASLPQRYIDAHLQVREDRTRVVVSPELREHVRFVKHDLLSAPLMSDARPFDLVSCRNVLIYFQRSAQQRALEALLDALVPGGMMFLGESEWPSGSASHLLQPISLRARLFSRREVEAA